MFNVTRYEVKNIAVLEIEGRVDGDGVLLLSSKLNDVFHAREYNIILEMSGVSYINSTGLSIIAAIRTRCREHGGDLRLVGLHPRVRRVFEIVGFDRYLVLNESLEQALAGV